MAHLNSLHNGYAAELGPWFDRIPKSVFAAIAVSALTQGGDYLEKATVRVCDEWRVLHDNGIVPQKPPKAAPTEGPGDGEA
jgi:hypothetical protein